MPEIVKIPISSTEYQARFAQPEIGFIGDGLNRAVKATVEALLPFGFRLANTEVVLNGPLSEHRLVFKLPEKAITIQFGAEAFTFLKGGSNWITAEADAEILAAAQTALFETLPVEISHCLVTVSLHAQLLEKKREEVLKPFIPTPFQGWRKLTTYGNHLKWDGGDLLFDFSALIANGIFVKYSTRFEGSQPVEALLRQLREHENSIFNILGIQEEADE
jgi:hypothetical protein